MPHAGDRRAERSSRLHLLTLPRTILATTATTAAAPSAASALAVGAAGSSRSLGTVGTVGTRGLWCARLLCTRLLRLRLAMMMVLGILVAAATAYPGRSRLARSVNRRRTIAVDFVENLGRLRDAVGAAIAVDFLMRVVMRIVIDIRTSRRTIVAVG